MKHKKVFIGISLALGLAQQVAQAKFDPSLELSDLDGLNGFTINGVDPVDQSGYSVSAAGDINGDGIDDVIISATFTSHSGITEAGSRYIVFGKSDLIFKSGFE